MNFILDALLANALVALFLALLAALVARRVKRPALAHALWLIVLLKLITPPLFSIHWPFSAAEVVEVAASAPEAADEEVHTVTPAPAVELPSSSGDTASTRQQLVEALTALRVERESVLATGSLTPVTPPFWTHLGLIRTVLAGIWLGGTLLWGSVFTWRIVRFHRLLGLGQPADDPLQTQAEELASRIGLHRCPQVWIVPGRVSPLLWMLGRHGKLVLPQELLDNLNHDQRAALLTHEMAHAHRLDHWVRWVELCALGLYWWNPVAWWARRELHQAEEECCDAWVVWILPGAARAYAKALLQTVTFLDARPCLPPVASGAGHVALLKRRLSMIVNEPLSPRLPKPLFCAALVWALLVLPFAPHRVIANAVDMEPGQTGNRQSNQSVEQRIQAIENKLDKVLKALDAQNSSESKPKKAAKDSQLNEEEVQKRLQESENRAKVMAEKAHALAAEAQAKGLKQAAEGRAMAAEARKAVEAAQTEMRKQLAQQREEMSRAKAAMDGRMKVAAEAREKAKSADEKVKEGKDEKKTERRVIINGSNMDSKAKVDLERMLKEKLGADFKMDELKKVIEESVDPAKMRQIQTKVHEMLRKSLDEKRKDMDKAFDEARKAMEVQANLLQKKLLDESAVKTEGKPKVAIPARAANVAGRDGELRDVQRRLERLEQRLDKVISSLESRNKKDGSN